MWYPCQLPAFYINIGGARGCEQLTATRFVATDIVELSKSASIDTDQYVYGRPEGHDI